MFIRCILFMSASISIGYIVHRILYWRVMHAVVSLEDDMCTGVDLIICLGIAGLLLAFL